MTKEECEIETSKAIMEMRNRIAELEKQISVLLSCKDCPDNKGGYICQKEYEDKCLAQKIQYIKELKAQIEKMTCCENCNYKDCDKSNSYETCWYCTNKDKWELRR